MGLSLRDFLKDTIETCIDNSIEFKLVNSEDQSGSFCDDPLELCSIIDSDDWLEVLVHETCHMDQYLEGDPLWSGKELEFNIFDGNLLKYADPKFIKGAFKAWVRLEIDCDHRAIKKIKRYNLKIDIPKYIQKSNCYHQSYYYFHKYHIFYDTSNLPFDDKYLISKFNDNKILDIEDIWCDNVSLENFLIRNNSKL